MGPRTARLALRRLRHALDNHGFGGLIRRALGKLPGAGTPPAHVQAGEDGEAAHPFDLERGTDTSGHIHGEQLAANLPADFYNTAYYGISPSSLRHALGLLPFAVEPYTFVDLGCGKGRALLVVAEFPFRKIVGVEIAEELAAVAARNTAGEGRIRVEIGDAAQFTLPEGPVVLYLYHPFLAPQLRRLLRRLERQVRERMAVGKAAPVWILYANLTYPKMLARFRLLRRHWEYTVPLSAEDAAVDRHGTTEERYTLFEAET